MKNSELIQRMIKIADDAAHEGDEQYEAASAAFHTASRTGKFDTARQRVIEMSEANGKIKACNKFRTALYELRSSVQDEPESVPPKEPST